MSVITWDMIESLAAHKGVSLEDGTNVPGVVGGLKDWEAGRGELDALLCDAEATRELFKPIRTAYFAALGKEEPPYSVV